MVQYDGATAGKMRSAIEIYVAMSRCREACCCLLTERFDKALFQSGPLRPENTILLARLRGDEDMFRELLEEHIEALSRADEARKAAANRQRSAAGRDSETQAARGAKNSSDSQARKGRTGGLANTSSQQIAKRRKSTVTIAQLRKNGRANTSQQQAEKGSKPKRKRAGPEVSDRFNKTASPGLLHSAFVMIC